MKEKKKEAESTKPVMVDALKSLGLMAALAGVGGTEVRMNRDKGTRLVSVKSRQLQERCSRVAGSIFLIHFFAPLRRDSLAFYPTLGL